MPKIHENTCAVFGDRGPCNCQPGTPAGEGDPDAIVQKELNGVEHALKVAGDFISGLSQYNNQILPKSAFEEARGILGDIRGAEHGPRIMVLRAMIERGTRIKELEALIKVIEVQEEQARAELASCKGHLPKVYAELGHELCVRFPEVAKLGMENAADSLGRLAADVDLSRELVSLLSDVVGDSGTSEGAVECLQRILKERTELKAAVTSDACRTGASSCAQCGALAVRIPDNQVRCLNCGHTVASVFVGIDRTKDKGGGVKERDDLLIWQARLMTKRVTLYRRTVGASLLIEKFDEPVSQREVFDRFGGGDYEIRCFKSADRGNVSYAGTRRFTIAGDPKAEVAVAQLKAPNANQHALYISNGETKRDEKYAGIFADGEDPRTEAASRKLVPVRANVPTGCCCGKPGGMHLGGCPLDNFHNGKPIVLRLHNPIIERSADWNSQALMWKSVCMFNKMRALWQPDLRYVDTHGLQYIVFHGFQFGISGSQVGGKGKAVPRFTIKDSAGAELATLFPTYGDYPLPVPIMITGPSEAAKWSFLFERGDYNLEAFAVTVDITQHYVKL